MLDTATDVQTERRPEERLDSWKAIAAYLGRDVSTVRRWERTEDLPVHRHRHAARGSAYAYTSELDAWFASRRAALGTNAHGPRPSDAVASRTDNESLVGLPAHASRARPRRWARAAWVGLGAAVAIALLATILGRQRASVPSTSFQPRDWVLVGDFDNRTGDVRLNDSVQYALERELTESQFLNVVSRERIGDTLRLMKRPLDTRLDRTTGAEVCLRDGGIRVLLTGRIEKTGGAYVLSALVVDPNDSGRTVAAVAARAPDESTVLDAVHELSGRIRRALGEDLRGVSRTPERLERVTTSSLRALQLYTQGVRAVDDFEWNVAVEFLEQAVEEDPNFASARIYLAHSLKNTGHTPEEYLPHAREAARLAEHQPDREQFFILASYETMIGNPDKAVAYYETLLKQYPDHFWGTNNLLNLYDEFGRKSSEQWRLMERLIRARPNDFITTVHAMQAALAAGVNLQRVDAMAAHARQLALTEPWTGRFEPIFLDFLPAFEAWVNEDLTTTIRLAESVSDRSPGHARTGALFELAAGRLTAAERLIAREDARVPGCRTCGSDRPGDLALAAFFRCDRGTAASHLAAAQRDYGAGLTLVVWLTLQVRSLNEAERFFRDWSARPDDGHTPPPDSPWGASVKAEFRLRRGDRAALADLEDAVRRHDQTRPRSLRASEALADALLAHGDLVRSAAVLEDATAVKTRVFSAVVGPLGETFGGVFWLRLRAKLASVYRRMGRIEDAERVDAQVGRMLVFADSDFRLLP